jgi:RNA polymerase sigma-70 factor (ECF subfamily)
MTPLVEQFLAARPERSAEVSDAGLLEERLGALWRAARARWPGFKVTEGDFVGWLAERVPAGAPLMEALARVQAEDLLLALACARGQREALAAFDAEYAGEVDRAVRKVGELPVGASDVAQMLRERLFVATEGRAPRIVDYSGQGPLRVWLRVALLRLVQNLATRASREAPVEPEALADVAVPGGDPELEHMRRLYREAFRAAFSGLEEEDRLLLRQRFGRRASQEELAAAYGVHVNTVARWLARAREALERGVRESLKARLRIGDVQFASILRLVRSQLDVTLGGPDASTDGEK